ncbi:hypothetical protein CDL15_Pgr006611 [Punica granatum]|uniref:Uncharacterized protein n=1 Tax=Punica granatum TaxID=22663 RepID=A0A218X7U3_PUNGR|nr:hypothetical protein CDL15_Pgr006611 [Punica granatum]
MRKNCARHNSRPAEAAAPVGFSRAGVSRFAGSTSSIGEGGGSLLTDAAFGWNGSVGVEAALGDLGEEVEEEEGKKKEEAIFVCSCAVSSIFIASFARLPGWKASVPLG